MFWVAKNTTLYLIFLFYETYAMDLGDNWHKVFIVEIRALLILRAKNDHFRNQSLNCLRSDMHVTL